jgi:hypothetical protein
MGVSDQFNAPAALPMEKKPAAHCWTYDVLIPTAKKLCPNFVKTLYIHYEEGHNMFKLWLF